MTKKNQIFQKVRKYFKMETNAILPEEIDYFSQSLSNQEVADIGTMSWLETHEKLLKLNQQAIIEAKSCREEVVKDMLVVQDKIQFLVHEAYCILVWRCKVFPKLLKSDKLTATFFIYTVLYHEINAISLLEIVLYHENSCESLGDHVIDLIDYCVHGLTQLIPMLHSGYNEKPKIISTQHSSPAEELVAQSNDIIFNIGIKSITILSYLSDKLSALPISAARRMMQTHDLPCLLSEILALRPYMRRIKGFEKFIDDKWVSVTGSEILKVTKVEAQTWFCLRQILFNKMTFDNYEINSFRQRELGKCSGLLNDALLDQLPPLQELKHFLCTLSISGNSGNGLNNLILEQIPEVNYSNFFLNKKIIQ